MAVRVILVVLMLMVGLAYGPDIVDNQPEPSVVSDERASASGR